jgi:branched-subunit amino acid ABC-type transport system permease component
MSLILPALVDGIVLAGLYGLLATGVVIVYNTSGVINFAQGAIAIFSVFVLKTLLDHGPGAENRPYYALAALVAVAVGALLAFLIDRLTLAPVRSSSPLNKAIITIGWLLALQSFAAIVFNAGVSTNIPPILPQDQLFAIGGLGVSQLDLAVVLTSLGIGAALTYFFRRTYYGVAMRAVAQDVDATRLMGVGVNRVSGLAWAIGGALAAIGGILVVPRLGAIDSSTLTLYLIQAFAAALIGGLRSLPRTALGALALGIIQSMVGILPGASGLPGLKFTTAFAVIVIALFFRPDLVRTGVRSVSERVVRPYTGSWWKYTRWAVIGAIAIFFVMVGTGSGDSGPLGSTSRLLWGQVFADGIVFLSLVVLVGFVGQISLCQMTFAGLGAYLTAIFSVDWRLPFPLAIALAALCTAPAGVLVGIPALRIRGLQLAVVTISFALVGDQLLFAQSFPLSGGATGRMINSSWGPVDIVNDDTSRQFFWIALGTLLALGIAVTALQRSPSGRRLFAVRDSENAATAVGISLTTAKLSAFALSAGIAGLGGALISLGDFGVVSSNDFFIGNSILYLALIILAGIRSVWGALLAGTFFIWGPNVIAWILSHAGFSTLQAANYQQMLSGALLILTVIVNPRGILGGLDDIPHLLRPMRRRSRETSPFIGAPTAPSTVT